MYNIAWYARDGYLDFFPLISSQLKKEGLDFSSHYVCHNELEEEHLRHTYNIKNPCILARSLKKIKDTINISDEKIKLLEDKYSAIPLVKCLWPDMFELNLSEDFRVRNLFSHIEFWENFLLENKIDMLVSEQPSILSTCIAWLVCKKYNIEFSAFVNIPPLDNRILISSSWYGHYDGLEDKFNNLEIKKESDTYRKVIEYLQRMKNQPRKTTVAITDIELAKRQFMLPFGNFVKKNFDIFRILKKDKLRTQYYIKPSLIDSLVELLKIHINSFHYRLSKVFAQNISLNKENYFLFPLHTYREWSNYASLGLGYADQLTLIKQISTCLPIGRKLYIKEHPAIFGQRPVSFYRAINKIPNLRLIGPYIDTFKLIRHSEGIVTVGGTMGFEAIILDKPVVIFAEPWYRNLPGVYRVGKPEVLAELLQNARNLRVPNGEEKIRIVYTLFDISFEGMGPGKKEAFSTKNISQFASAMHRKITEMQSLK